MRNDDVTVSRKIFVQSPHIRRKRLTSHLASKESYKHLIPKRLFLLVAARHNVGVGNLARPHAHAVTSYPHELSYSEHSTCMTVIMASKFFINLNNQGEFSAII